MLRLNIFQSLNCSICSTPYSKVTNDDHSPRQTSCENMIAMCKKCFQKQKALPKDQRLHQCPTNSCYIDWGSRFYLYDILLSDGLQIDYSQQGYRLTAAIETPECPICNEDYAGKSSNFEPFGLLCGHALCNGCFKNMSVLRSDPYFPIGLTCSLCQQTHYYAQDTWENPLKMFLREYPKHLLRLDLQENERICDECEEKALTIRMFSCRQCEKTLCGECGLRNHRDHEIIALEKEEINKLKTKTIETLRPQITTYNQYFAGFHDEVIKNIFDFQKILIERVHLMENYNFKEANHEQSECLTIGNKFESLADKYLGDLRIFNSGMESLLELAKLQKDSSNL